MDFLAPHTIAVDELFHQELESKKIRLLMARLDLVHPVVSGNKIFKLKPFLQLALQQPADPVITFGGAFSNHLAASAFACQALGLRSIGIVRGEQPVQLSPTLKQCKDAGMELQFISRKEYAQMKKSHISLQGTVIPEGGYSPAGAEGASEIMQCLSLNSITHAVTATGTGTTLAGLLQKASPEVSVISVPVLKNLHDLPERLQFLNGQNRYTNLDVWPEFHFGGYAKRNKSLIDFINRFYNKYHIPLDFVYTAKMMYGVIQKINDHYFPPGSVICCLHTGGLQGNRSLPEGTLDF